MRGRPRFPGQASDDVSIRSSLLSVIVSSVNNSYLLFLRCCVKVMTTDPMLLTNERRIMLIDEVSLLKRLAFLRERNVLQLIGAALTEDPLMMVFEKIEW